jgi:hypothetical protein
MTALTRARKLMLGGVSSALMLAAATLESGAGVGSSTPAGEAAASQPALVVTHYRTATVDGVSVFYREAGPADAPVVLLLHAFQRPRTCSAT